MNQSVFGQKFLPKIKLNNFFGLPLVVLTTVSLRRSFSFSRHRLKYGWLFFLFAHYNGNVKSHVVEILSKFWSTAGTK